MKLSGGIQAVQVSGAVRRAVMGTHKVEKIAGDVIRASINWTAGTRDHAGVTVPWSYRLRISIGHNTTWGWRIGPQLGFPLEMENQVKLFSGAYAGSAGVPHRRRDVDYTRRPWGNLGR